MYPAWHHYTLQDYGVAALWNSLAVVLVLITRTLLKQQLVIENFEVRLNSEIERRDRRQK